MMKLTLLLTLGKSTLGENAIWSGAAPPPEMRGASAGNAPVSFPTDATGTVAPVAPGGFATPGGKTHAGPGATGGDDAQPTLYWADDGCHTEDDDKPDDFEGAYFTPEHEFAVRCCSMDGKSCKSPRSCPDSATYDWAEASCQGEGMRLCKKSELESGVCCHGGCGFDSKQVWASTEPTRAMFRAAPQTNRGAPMLKGGELDISQEEEEEKAPDSGFAAIPAWGYGLGAAGLGAGAAAGAYAMGAFAPAAATAAGAE
eukprot:TRINITY_DN943_c0_g1_i2.p1 TRINITY_DN943_c0_g1~~TRINITY_DN943_c0_g1_i2.p1  ORF type:complete len:257 (-),score=33.90 TRINITY_DN943_c0_g1_i2:333-1103(-)